MTQLRRDYQRFAARDTEILVFGPESAPSFRRYWEKEELPFIGVPDPAHKVLRLYGQEVRLLKLGRMPAQVLIDKSGQIRYVHYGRSMADIPTNEDVFRLLDDLG
ncbi:MAG: thioredoxin peroxidase [Desulfobulbus propionicus]|nr:MAG: thioredoxin peroxidase [Desulfobulbus propionicus]